MCLSAVLRPAGVQPAAFKVIPTTQQKADCGSRHQDIFAAAIPRSVVAVLCNCIIVLKIKLPLLATLMSPNNNNKVGTQILIKLTVPKHLLKRAALFCLKNYGRKFVFIIIFVILFILLNNTSSRMNG